MRWHAVAASSIPSVPSWGTVPLEPRTLFGVHVEDGPKPTEPNVTEDVFKTSNIRTPIYRPRQQSGIA